MIQAHNLILMNHSRKGLPCFRLYVLHCMRIDVYIPSLNKLLLKILGLGSLYKAAGAKLRNSNKQSRF